MSKGSSVRQQMTLTSLKGQMKALKQAKKLSTHKMQQIGHSSRNLMQRPITLPTQEAFEETSEEDDDPNNDIVHHVTENPLI